MKTKLLLIAFLLMAAVFSTQAANLWAPVTGPLNITLITSNSVSFSFTVTINGGGKANTYIQHNTVNSWLTPIASTKVGAPTSTTTFQTTVGGLLPGTTYFFRYYSANSDGSTISQVVTATTSANPQSGLPPVISNINVTNIKDTKATVNFALDAQNNGNVSYNIKYSTDQNFGTGNGIVGGQTTTKTSAGGNIAEVISGLTATTVFYYKISATSGTTNVQQTESAVGTFTTTAYISPVTIAEFKFENNYASEIGSILFGSNAGTSFTTDRHGNENGAININNTGAAAYIPGLPYGSANRSISVWAKTNALNNQINYIFHYGTSASGNGLAFRPSTILYFANANANLETANTTANNTWVHYVCTYDGTTAKVYVNGSLFSSGAKTFDTANNSDIFKLGLAEGGQANYFNGAVDDLKIFDEALTDAQIAMLYTNNQLTTNRSISANNFSVYPNPTYDILNFSIGNVTTKKEVIDFRGNKLAETYDDKILVAHLPAGFYIVKFTQVDNQIFYAKFMKN
jgi:hypothetical protein